MTSKRNLPSVPQQINTPKLECPISPYQGIPKSPFTPYPFHMPFQSQENEFLSFVLNSKPQDPGKQMQPHIEDIYRWMIDFVVQNVDCSQEYLLSQLKSKHECKSSHQEVFRILIKKFKKLRKTKEEMTKYCMRKAFKFLGEKMKNQGNMQRGQTQFNLQYYFPDNRGEEWLSIPFRKNSIEKTMNTSFLKKIFSSSQFIQDYKEFIRTFKNLAKQDNERKINYLSQIVQQAIVQANPAKIQSVKRLPWTQPMLRKTEELALKLLQYRPSHLKDSGDISFHYPQQPPVKIERRQPEQQHYGFCPNSPSFQSHDCY